MRVPNEKMAPGHLLEYRCPKFGLVFQWRILGIYLGATRQESLIEVEAVFQSPGTDSAGAAYPKMMVPEPMTRGLSVIAPGVQQ
ncbi:hypothetical protein [Roseovarius atlanticus]|uniref:hypothetical protein n=1 Tax=Roseovarius atlanticus TaxID=1641875 RepID=UPI001C988033|nr:hypothetical protein [Roseovarius atlanticus]MBY5988209.1 hypothetical protein [Roseovarius atlanticus]MBY6123600.1 hypothetical protein [Roseovarius atlanticus]MBY6148095.1 hypothetical protein [Roseovarius atlanticus]